MSSVAASPARKPSVVASRRSAATRTAEKPRASSRRSSTATNGKTSTPRTTNRREPILSPVTPKTPNSKTDRRPIRTQRTQSPQQAKTKKTNGTRSSQLSKSSQPQKNLLENEKTPKSLPNSPDQASTIPETKKEEIEQQLPPVEPEEISQSKSDSFVDDNPPKDLTQLPWSSDDEEFLDSPLIADTPTFPLSAASSINGDDTTNDIKQRENIEEPDSEAEEDNNSLYSDNGFSYVRDMLHLKGELKSKNYQLKGLIQETTRLEKTLSKREKSLFDLNADLHRTNEKVLCLEQELQSREEENEALRAELDELKNKSTNSRRPSIPKRNKKNESTMQRLDTHYQAARSVAVATSSLDSLPEELYKHVLALDNQLNVTERKFQKVKKENVEVTQRCKELELFSQKTSKQLQACKKKAKEDVLSLKHLYSEQIAQFSHREAKHQKELKTIRSNEHLKSKRLLELESIAKQVSALENQISYNEKEKRAKDRQIVNFKKEIKRLQYESKNKDTQLTKVTDANKVFPVKMWQQDRKLFQSKLENMKATIDSKDRTIEAQRVRIIELCDRVDLIASSMHPDAKRENDIAAQINGTFRSVSGSQRATSSQSHAPLLETSLRGEKTKIELIEDDGEEGELTDDLFDFPDSAANPNEEGEKGSEYIPVNLYKLMEQEVQKLQVHIQRLEEIIQQRDDAIENLEHAYDELAKVKVVNAGKETEEIVEKLSSVESENRKREKQYRLQIHKLQNIKK